MRYYITTPIYYVNDQPHIGHAYTSLAADVLCIFNRMQGKDVSFLTGTDEHGQKVEQAARGRGLSSKAHADEMVENFKSLWDKLNLTHSAFIRTTDAGHKDVVKKLLMQLWEKGEIEKRTYTGWYCTPCERFWTEKDLQEGNKCPDCGREVEEIKEDNYFFLMSKYAKRLEDHIKSNDNYILPKSRRNEVLGFLKQPLGDLCISRPKSRLSWGVTLPFDEDYVSYVWFDALINYYSATKYLLNKDGSQGDKKGDMSPWPADVHLIGKDILTTHAVYWSTMLMALDIELPKTIFAHGWWTIEGQKMSKSVGNVVKPADLVDKYGNDAFRYFLFREVTFGLDGDYSEEALVGRINTDLANDFGNLASRTLKMASNFFDSTVPEPAASEEAELEMRAIASGIHAAMQEALDTLQFGRALDEIWKLLSFANRYIDTSAPWKLAKDPELEGRLRTVIYHCLEALRLLALYMHPFMPEATAKLYMALGYDTELKDAKYAELGSFASLVPGTKLRKLENLFPRINTKKTEKKKDQQKEKKKVQEKEETDDNLITIKDFAKVELKTGKITEAEHVEGSNKLVRVQVDTGEMRQVVAGIGKAYAAEDLVGKTIVVVTNLKPAKLMGIESQGMLLAATAEDGVPVLLSPEKDVPAGLRIK
jgi:methionyl-tRNA synthetase